MREHTTLKTSPRTIRRLVFQTAYSGLGIICTLYLTVILQAGNSGLYLFFINDLLTEPKRLAFTLSFPSAFLTALFVLGYTLRIPRFDFFNRILAINVLIYSFLGLIFSTLRLPLFSREVFISEFFLSGILLVIYYILCHRLYPKRLGMLADVDVTLFKSSPSLEAIPVDAMSIQDQQFDGIVTNLRGVIDDDTTHLLADLAQRHIPVYDVNVLLETLWGRISLADLTPIEIESFTPPVIYGLVKRIGEVALIIVCTPLLIVLWSIISIAIKLDSPGPILFAQTRTGLNGTTFTMLKFRSMFVTKEQENRFAERNDKRVTRVGWVLRRLRLDELPQFWSVIRGDMSLIGPRPEQLEFTKRFNQLIPFYGFRHTIRPGITGWAQVMYGYAASDEQTRAKLELDFFYIKHMSAWLDLVVLVKTIRTIILGSGAR